MDESIVKLVKRLLLNAINDYIAYDEGTDIYEETQWWLFKDDSETPRNGCDCYTLIQVCNVLRLDVERVRFVLNFKRDRMRSQPKASWWMGKTEFEKFLFMTRELYE